MANDTPFQLEQNEPREPLTLAGKRYIVRDHISAIVQVALALGAARTLEWDNAWLYGAMALAAKVGSAILLARVNPAVLNARGTKQALSTKDKVFFAAFIPSVLALPVVAGLDAGGVGWTHHSTVELALGLAAMVLGIVVVVWALAVNRFFEPTVRLQRDRGHRVCTSGPYELVRHPGYVGAIVATAGGPLVLGSYWAFVPVVVMTIAFVCRTAFEDRMLREELPGYEAYAAKTRFRLLPGVW